MLKDAIVPVKETYVGCINCKHYGQLFRENKGNLYIFFPTKYGICTHDGKEEIKEYCERCIHFEHEKRWR